MKTHDLTHLIKYTHMPLPTRLYVGHYGDGYMLPKYCILTKTKLRGTVYGAFTFEHPAGRKECVDITIHYSDDETNAYERFINKLSKCNKFCDIDYLKLIKRGKYGATSKLLYEQFKIPRIIGASLYKYRNKSYAVTSVYLKTTTITHFNINSSREEVIQKIKEHLAKMPAGWLAKHHIPELYLA